MLENYCNGDLLTTIDKALGMARGMTYKSVHPQASLVTGDYPKGIKLDKPALQRGVRLGLLLILVGRMGMVLVVILKPGASSGVHQQVIYRAMCF